MELGKLNKLVLRGGLSIVAALMLSGAAFAQDGGTGEGVSDPAIELVVVDGDPSVIDEAPVKDEDTVVAIGEDGGIAEGEPVLIDGEYVEGEYVDGEYIEGEYVDGTDGDGMMYTMDGEVCIECNVIIPGRPINPTEVQRNLTDDAPLTTSSRSSTSRSSAAIAVTSTMAQCLAQHPRSTWICEWQNGAGQ